MQARGFQIIQTLCEMNLVDRHGYLQFDEDDVFDAAFEQTLRKYAQAADALIYDAQYTPEEYETKQGWGHSTWLEATQIAQDCKVKQLVLFHHDPGHNDAMMQEIVAQARTHFANTDAAREGMEINL